MKNNKGISHVASKIKDTYASYNCRIKLRPYIVGNNGKWCIFGVSIKPGTKVSHFFSQAENVRACLGIPVFRPIYKSNRFFLHVSYEDKCNNALGPLLDHIHCNKDNESIPVAIGYNEFGTPFIEKLNKVEHVLFVGTTCSGKSTGLINLILSLVLIQSPNDVNIILFDIGSNSFEKIEGVPHLAYPIIKDKLTGSYVLTELTQEMDRRIFLSADELYSQPRIVCVIDEFTSLIANLNDKALSDQYRNLINNLLRRGRKAKIHMVLATQNATQEAMQSDVGNITTRFVYHLLSAQSSRAVLGEAGAETLCNRGDLLYKSCNMPNSCRLKGAIATDQEISEWISRLKLLENDFSKAYRIPIQNCKELYFQKSIDSVNPEINDNNKLELSKIILFAISRNFLSANQLKKEFNIGNRVNTIMNQLCDMQIISAKDGNKPRAVLPKSRSDLTEETVNLLLSNEVSEEIILSAFAKRAAAEEPLRIE